MPCHAIPTTDPSLFRRAALIAGPLFSRSEPSRPLCGNLEHSVVTEAFEIRKSNLKLARDPNNPRMTVEEERQRGQRWRARCRLGLAHIEPGVRHVGCAKRIFQPCGASVSRLSYTRVGSYSERRPLKYQVKT